MHNQKTDTPNSILDVKQYIFCDFDDGFVLSDPRFVKIFKSCQKIMKSFDLSFKKDIPHFKMSLARCPHCGTRHVVKYGFTKRTLVFKEIGKLKLKFSVIFINVVVKPFKQIYRPLLIKIVILRMN